MRGRPWEYVFYVDSCGDDDEPPQCAPPSSRRLRISLRYSEIYPGVEPLIAIKVSFWARASVLEPSQWTNPINRHPFPWHLSTIRVSLGTLI